MSEFQGFPEAALDFYDDLEMDNTKSFWEAHKAVNPGFADYEKKTTRQIPVVILEPAG